MQTNTLAIIKPDPIKEKTLHKLLEKLSDSFDPEKDKIDCRLLYEVAQLTLRKKEGFKHDDSCDYEAEKQAPEPSAYYLNDDSNKLC